MTWPQMSRITPGCWVIRNLFGQAVERPTAFELRSVEFAGFAVKLPLDRIGKTFAQFAKPRVAKQKYKECYGPQLN